MCLNVGRGAPVEFSVWPATSVVGDHVVVVFTSLTMARTTPLTPVLSSSFTAGITLCSSPRLILYHWYYPAASRCSQASSAVKLLEAELASEMQEHEHTMKESMLEIRSLKEELLRNKTESQVLLSTEEKKLKAEESALERALQQKEVGDRPWGTRFPRPSVSFPPAFHGGKETEGRGKRVGEGTTAEGGGGPPLGDGTNLLSPANLDS